MILLRLGSPKHHAKAVTAEILEGAGIRLYGRTHQRLELLHQHLLVLHIDAWEQGQCGRHMTAQHGNQLAFALGEGQRSGGQEGSFRPDNHSLRAPGWRRWGRQGRWWHLGLYHRCYKTITLAMQRFDDPLGRPAVAHRLTDQGKTA